MAFTSKLGLAESVIGQNEVLGLTGNTVFGLSASHTLSISQQAVATVTSTNKGYLSYMPFKWGINYRSTVQNTTKWK